MTQIAIQQRDAPMAQIDQQVDRILCDRVIVDREERIVDVGRCLPVQGKGNAPFKQKRHTRIIRLWRVEDEPIQDVSLHHPLVRRHGISPFRIDRQHKIGVPRRKRRCQPGQHFEERLIGAHVRLDLDDHANHAGAPRDQPLSHPIGPISKAVGRLLYLVAGLLVDFRKSVQRTTDSRHGQPKLYPNVFQRRHVISFKSFTPDSPTYLKFAQ